jgi:hypothetical protein
VIQKPPKKFLLNQNKENKMTDRDVNYMREMWGTTQLVTDYKPERKKLLREVTDEKFKKEQEPVENELFDSWDYGLESLTPIS